MRFNADQRVSIVAKREHSVARISLSAAKLKPDVAPRMRAAGRFFGGDDPGIVILMRAATSRNSRSPFSFEGSGRFSLCLSDDRARQKCLFRIVMAVIITREAVQLFKRDVARSISQLLRYLKAIQSCKRATKCPIVFPALPPGFPARYAHFSYSALGTKSGRLIPNDVYLIWKSRVIGMTAFNAV